MKVINRASYVREYLHRTLVVEPLSVQSVPPEEFNALVNNSAKYQQLAQRGALQVQGIQDGKMRIANLTPTQIAIRFPLVRLVPGENDVPDELWQKVLEEYDQVIWALQGQKDGLIF